MEHPTPRPADLPLPGGTRAGGGVRVHPLRTAEMKAMPDFYARPAGPGPLAIIRGMGLHRPRSQWFWVPIPAFLIEHPQAGPILIDTGMHEQVATDVGAALGRLAKIAFTIDMRPEWAVPAQLRERGIDPAGIALIVMTHLHYDHASGLSQFPRATVVVDEREWAAARRGRITDGYLPHLFPATQEWRTLPGDADEVDLLGDGTIRLLSTPGHTPGHRSVALRLDDGTDMLLTGDAAYAQRTIDEDLLPVLTWRDGPYRASLNRVRDWIAAHPGAPVVTGHDAATWPALAPVYPVR
ncbi:MAG TPA: N-acyl homoserine lactonase family protein [Baekduia sp.]|uniref:N-acyl homoserine lactonase family protein n=1 Tax=Baekduia sp. TaxID=2600305 RepID=UPI002C024651|nr:N-acyl homoserine lactonase family protein [Baekduia sp.]HMJ32403.1 N-acyl homoserine lactonase family protein [Baekduia sp.]